MTNPFRLCVVILVAAVLGVATRPLGAAISVWDGGGANNNWSSDANWVQNFLFDPPANDGTDDITMAGTVRLTPLVDVAFDINSLQFNPTAGAFAFQAGGQDLFIRGGGITNNDADLQIISRMSMGANHTWTAAAGPLQVNFVRLGSTANRMLTVSGSFDTSIQGIISGGILTNGGSILLNSTANFTLAGFAGQHNSFTGPVTVNSGTLILNKPAGITAVPGNLIIGDGVGSDVVKWFQDNQVAETSNVTISSSGLLNLNGANETVNSLTINGGSVTQGNGVLAITGSVTTSAAAATASISGGTLDLGAASRTFAIADGSAPVDAEVSSSIANGGVIKSGAGTLRFSGANAYSEPTTVTQGTLELNGATFTVSGDLTIGDGIGGVGADRVVLLAPNQVQLPFYPGVPHPVVTVKSSGVLQMNGLAQGVDALFLDGGAAVDIGAGGTLTVETVTCTGIGNAPATIDGNNLRKRLNGVITVDVADGPATDDLILSGRIQEFNSISKTGPGQLVLAGTLGNEGGCSLAAGTVVLAKSITDGARFIAARGGTTARWAADEQVVNVDLTQGGGGTMDLNGFSETLISLSVGSLATLVTGGGRLTVTQQTRLQGGASVNTETGTLELAGTLETLGAAQNTVAGNLILIGAPLFVLSDGTAAIDLEISGQIGGGGFQRVPGTFGGGDGHLLLSGPANTNSGSITVAVGKLSLNKSGTDGAVRGGLVIGDGVGSAVVQLLASEQILAAPENTLTMNVGGLLDLNGSAETILDVVMNGGSITTGAGVLTVVGELTASGTGNSLISGKVDLGGATRTFTVNDGAAVTDLDVPATISNGAIVKQGPGTLRLSGASDFAGGFTLSAGRLIVGADTAAGTGILSLDGTVEGADGNRVLSNPISITGPVTFAGPVDMSLMGSLSNPFGSGLVKTGGASLAIAGAQSHGVGATLDALDGDVRFQSDAGSPATAVLIVRVIGASASIELETTQHLAAMNVNAGSARLTQGGAKVLVTRSLNVDTTDALIDIWEHAIIVDYTSASPVNSIKSAITSAYDNSAWDGFGITSSLADATHGVGYGESAALNLTSFEGESIDATAVLIKFTYLGDTNLDGQVDITDLGNLATNWQSSSVWTGGDSNYDGFVDITDLGMLATNWQAGVGSPLGATFEAALASLGLPGADVPEPAGAALLALLGIPARRRRGGLAAAHR